MQFYLKTNKEDLDKITYLGFDAEYIIDGSVVFAKIKKDSFSFPQFGNITEEQFFLIMKNSEKASKENIREDLQLFIKPAFKPYGFSGNYSYRERVKKIIKPLLN